MPPARPRPRPRYEEIAETLAARIRAGAVGANGRMPSERALMEQFGVGRSTVREALFALRKLGLVSVRSGAVGAVTEPTPKALIDELSILAKLLIADDDGMRHFQRARALFEIGVAREVALTIDPEKVGRLREALAANLAAIGNQKAFVETDVEFHRALAAATENPIYLALHDGFTRWLAEQRSISAMAGAAQATVHAEHERIFAAVASGNAAGAQDAMQAHLDGVVRHYWQARTLTEGARNRAGKTPRSDPHGPRPVPPAPRKGAPKRTEPQPTRRVASAPSRTAGD